MTCNRSGNKWTINESLSLQREYELLELNVEEIAKNHQRSELAIAYKLKTEGLINYIEDARGFIPVKSQNIDLGTIKSQNIDLVYSLEDSDESVADDVSSYIADDCDYEDDDSTYIDDENYEDEDEVDEEPLTTNIRLSIMTTQLQSLDSTVKQLAQQITQMNQSLQNDNTKKFVNQYLQVE